MRRGFLCPVFLSRGRTKSHAFHIIVSEGSVIFYVQTDNSFYQ